MLIGVAIVTLQTELWEDQFIIVTPHWFKNCDLAQNKCNLSCPGRFLSFTQVSLIYESPQQKLG